MRKSLGIATFLVAGAGVGALGALDMKGSDTLRTVTLDMTIAVSSCAGTPLCPGTGINYVGGGSGSGENAMLVGNQTVAPMSRFLGGQTFNSDGGIKSQGICKGALDSGLPTAANGLIVGLDGLGIVASSALAGTTTCNGTAGGDDAGACASPGVPLDSTVGFAWNTTVAGYTFADWKDVLRILYMGQDHSGSTNCNSSIRNTLANNWSSVFEAAGCTAANCSAGIKHLFRRDDASGTTDIFAQLLGFGGPTATGGAAVTASVATSFGNSYNMGSDAFCNSAVNTPAPFNSTAPGNNPGAEPGAGFSIVPNDDQDGDPIRRACASGRNLEWVCQTSLDLANTMVSGTTFTCGATGGGTCPTGETCVTGTSGSQCWGPSLGLELPIVTTNTLGADQYHINRCAGAVNSVQAPLVPGAGGRGVLNAGICPNGDTPTAGVCQVPIDTSNNSPNCLATSSVQPQGSVSTTQGAYVLSSGTATATGNGPDPRTIDARVYNKYVWRNTGTPQSPVWSVAKDDSNRPVYGAYYRIHSDITTISGTAPCTQPDATLQIGCLVAASPCSFGYAGKEAASQPGAVAMKIKGVPPVTACIQALGAGPFDGGTPQEYFVSRKLYLNSIAGFPAAGTADAGELALATCESNPSTIGAALDCEHFVRLPTTGPNALNGGAAICEDFNEQMLCGDAAPNVNGCSANSGVGLPTASVICGNGVKEAFEECDPLATLGTADNPCAIKCSTSCRCD
jgi:hypothetical protein